MPANKLKNSILRVLLCFATFIYCYPPYMHAQQVPLTPGMQLHQSASIKPGSYRLPGMGDTIPVVRISGDSLLLDFAEVYLRGDKDQQLPDRYAGLGILVENSRHVTIRNLKVRGYKIGLMARNVEKLVLENCDLSYNYRKRLNSTALKEDLSDWMSYHHNENDEWLRYGAAFYLRNCQNFEVKNCRVTGGQNALMLVNCNNGKVLNNDFSFNSGIGIGLYRSSKNLFAHNKVNFNVRGYSHGVYNRGQDSAGFLVYEQSSSNIFYRNSATHSGDGFFLWAGQSTMDSGRGGCNDNLIAGNNFSYAPTNGIEVTFSRNMIVRNRMYDCDHGIWGGYSYDTRIADNQFRNNRIAIAIEHGQRNIIDFNTFNLDREAIRLWARASQPADWGYARQRDTRSYNYQITGNSFNWVGTALNLNRTDSVWVFSNLLSQVTTALKTDSTVGLIDSLPAEIEETFWTVPEVENSIDAFEGSGKLAGRENIRMTEWGPYDYRRPLIWQQNPAENTDTIKLKLLGPAGRWTFKKPSGARLLSRRTAGTGDSLLLIRTGDPDSQQIKLSAKFKGEAGTSFDGWPIEAGKKQDVVFRHFFQSLHWRVRWFAVDTSRHNPLGSSLFPENVRLRPIKTDSVDQLEYAWWGGIKSDLGNSVQFLTIAEGEAKVPKGEYELSITWDDAVRVYLDDELILDEWNPALYKFDESPNRRIPVKLGGYHRFRVEHVELGGFATLSMRLEKTDP